MFRYVTFAVLLAAGSVGCGFGKDPMPTAEPASRPREEAREVFVFGTHNAIFQEVEPAEAEAVLIIEVVVPGFIKMEQRQFPLKRDRSGEHGGWLGYGFWLSSGGGHGVNRRSRYNGSVSIQGQSVDRLTVELDLDWTTEDGEKGKATEAVELPWLGSARKELNRGGWLHAYFDCPDR
jgi:hypothetical protein